MIRLVIEPKPTAEEAAAIEAALKLLTSPQSGDSTRLRYGDVNGPKGPLLHLSWGDVARIEALGQRRSEIDNAGV